ncbi:hypothetical protein FGIG_10880 [Fasciola gigantica]|uniref:Uncharacterized protein n=1 Tax=Fasciola gigantica TaxID=46835 RepID=A0A504YM01_FASGI|nr:hypothetical protein FGIG_10880 [Fasciola gigantica]
MPYRSGHVHSNDNSTPRRQSARIAAVQQLPLPNPLLSHRGERDNLLNRARSTLETRNLSSHKSKSEVVWVDKDDLPSNTSPEMEHPAAEEAEVSTVSTPTSSVITGDIPVENTVNGNSYHPESSLAPESDVQTKVPAEDGVTSEPVLSPPPAMAQQLSSYPNPSHGSVH